MKELNDRYVSSTQVCDFALAYIDLLGHRDLYRNCLVRPPESDVEGRQRFLESITKIAASIATVQDRITGSINAIKTAHKELLGVEIDDSVLKAQWFSDGVCLFAKIDEKDPFLSVSILWSMLHSCAHLLVTNLAMGFPLRCGVAVGSGFELREGEIYGPVLSLAYETESRVAIYPRIALDESLCKSYRELKATRMGCDPRFKRDPFMLFESLAGVDFDGVPIVDYCNQNGLEQFVFSEAGRTAFVKAHEFAKASFDLAIDLKVRQKYGYLAKYIGESGIV